MKDFVPSTQTNQTLIIACDVFRQRLLVSNGLFSGGRQLLYVHLEWTFSHGIRAYFSSCDSMVERYVSSQYQIIAI